MQLLICDDEITFCEQYKNRAEQILGEAAGVRIYTDSCIFWRELQESGGDIVLLDIDMPGLDGLEIAAKMQQMETRPILIFITSQDALVYDSFQYHPFGFIRKTHVDKELERVLLEAVKEWKKQSHRYRFRCENETVSLNTEQILYLEAMGNYLELHTGERSYRIRETMAGAQEDLAAYGFVRIHKGFLVNERAVWRIGNREVVLEGDIRLPIGKSYKEQVKEKLVRLMMA